MSGVEYSELVAFLAVARERRFRRAADALAISPSAVSHTLRALEDRLGAKLLNRTTPSHGQNYAPPASEMHHRSIARTRGFRSPPPGRESCG